jgi:hypothetical protein
MAKEHADAAFQTLVRVSNDLEAPAAAQVTAGTAILDRAYGRPKQALIGGDEDDPVIKTVTRIERRIVRPDDPDR